MEEITLEVNNLLTFTRAAEMLSVSRPTVYNLVNKNQLHPVVIGRNRYLLRHEVERLKRDMNEEAAER